jgi:signal transduction histidine kinase
MNDLPALHRPTTDAWSGVAEHVVQFYEADAVLLDGVAEFIGAGLRSGDAGLVLATPAHRAGVEERLRAAGLDVAGARASGQYAALDAAEALTRFMVDGAPDPARFAATIGDAVARASSGGRRARLFGEMVALLVDEGNHAAAIRLEQLWNELQQSHAFSLLCAYPMARLGGETLAEALGDICAAHARVIPAESYMGLPTPDERLRAVARLQQRATWLESEISQRRRAEERLRVALEAERIARQEAEAALQLRDEFLSIAAHELRTPLAGLLGYAQLAQRQLKRAGQLEPERVAQAMDIINNQAGKLSRLLSQLLDVSRLEAGKLTLERQATDLTVLVEHVVAGARGLAHGRAITVAAPPSVEAWVDPLRLEQALMNLLDNAIKYSPADGEIEVGLARPLAAVVEIWVRDRGPGVPPERRARLFERFYQAHGNGHLRGLGLGLSIARQVVELHGGEIRAEFPPDGGARFVMRLPITPDEPPGRPQDRA